MSAPRDLDRFFDLSLDMLCIAGFDGYFKALNPAWEKTLGFTVEELLAKPYIDFIHPEDRARTDDQAERQTHGQDAMNFENRYLCKDGSYKWLLWQATQIPSEGVIYAIARDITERKRLEAGEKDKLQAQLFQAQKMEAVGRLAGGVAHDFNNLLTAINGFAHLVLAGLPPDSPQAADVREIEKAGQRAADLTRQLLAFSRRQVLQPRILVLNNVLTDLQRLLKRLLGADIQVETRLAPGLWTVKADCGSIEQIVMNLAVNSRDAMPAGGRLVLETANVELGHDYPRTHLDAKPGPYVMLAVTDTGHGMSQAVQSRIFEPFFTTKGPGLGTGLGLATVYGIVKQAGGSIFVYSEPGQGTTFKVYLSRTLESAQDGEGQAPQPALTAIAGARVLLVEDDAQVRAFVRRVLAGKGYAVSEADSGDKALALAEAAPPDLLVTDMVMPGLRGDELVRRLRARPPAPAVVFMSGYTETGILPEHALGPTTRFVQKPIDPEELLRLCGEALAAAAPDR